MNNTEVDYWTKFYSTFNCKEPSNFAKFILDYIEKYNKKFNILDVGCGNGRDSYFLSTKHNVTGIDISNLPTTSDNDNCTFVTSDMTTYDKTGYDLVYSRFTLHSITDEQQEQLISSIKPNTILCIETRSIKGIDQFREHGDTHYRNLTCIDKLKQLLSKYNFNILYLVESNNLAVYKNEDPICIRVICTNTVL